MTLPNTIPDRRVDLDWLRIAAFGLLIFYHVGMFYVTWDWHVKSSHASHAIEPLMRLTNPWRLTLLFVISGCATRFMLDKMDWGRFLGSRTVRLVIPLLFGVFVIVPPQTYLEVVGKLGFSGGFAEFYGKYATASGGWTPGGETLVTPTYNHLWFVLYLFVYTLLVVPVGPLLKRAPRWLAPLAKGAPVVILPWLFLVATIVMLEPLFGETHALIDDWYNHAVYFTAFLFGYAIAKHEPFFESCQNMRWPLAVLALASWVALEFLRASIAPGADAPAWLRPLGAVLREVQAWTTILALFGFARNHLRRDGPVRRYLTDAIFPFYIIHQTAIVISGFYLNQLGWPVWIEAPVVIAITLSSCWLGYEIVRRVGILRPLFGLKMESRPVKAASPQPA